VIGAVKTVRRLLQKYAGARDLLTIPAAEWNEAVAVLMQNRPLVLGAGRPGGQFHPWEISARWDVERKAVRYRVHPGFVNSRAATIGLSAKDAPPAFALAAGARGNDRLEVPLTAEPEAIIQAGQWRAIGSDAAPIGVQSNSDFTGASFVFESVPPFFLALGVTEAEPMAVGLLGGFQRWIEGDISTPPVRRLLRSVDVVLTQPRPAMRALVDVDGNGANGSFVSLGVTYELPGDPTPRIAHRTRFEPIDPIPETSILTGALRDEPFDQLHIASIYAVSPASARDGDAPDASWAFYARHHEFWNLNHATNRIVPASPPSPLQFPIPLAGGAATLMINSMLAVINDNAEAAMAMLAGNRLEGRFWSV